MSGFICSNSVYEFKGWVFEFHKYCGPWPLKKDGQPKKKAGAVFWRVWSEFCKLTPSEQEVFNLHRGGCRRF